MVQIMLVLIPSSYLTVHKQINVGNARLPSPQYVQSSALRLTSDYIRSTSPIEKAPYNMDHYIVMYR